MRQDPLGPIVQAFEAAQAKYTRDYEVTRSGWDDSSRRSFDSAFGERIRSEIQGVIVKLRQVSHEVSQAEDLDATDH